MCLDAILAQCLKHLSCVPYGYVLVAMSGVIVLVDGGGVKV